MNVSKEEWLKKKEQIATQCSDLVWDIYTFLHVSGWSASKLNTLMSKDKDASIKDLHEFASILGYEVDIVFTTMDIDRGNTPVSQAIDESPFLSKPDPLGR